MFQTLDKKGESYNLGHKSILEQSEINPKYPGPQH